MRFSGRMMFEDSSATPRSMMFSSSRTLPGKSYCMSTSMP